VARVTDIDSGTVTGQTVRKQVTHSIRDVMPVPKDSTVARIPPGQGDTGDASVDEMRKRDTWQLYDKVNAFLNVPRALQSIRTHIGAAGVQLIMRNQMPTVPKFMKLWGFRLVAGMWQRGKAA
jgi:hypothetical protein